MNLCSGNGMAWCIPCFHIGQGHEFFPLQWFRGPMRGPPVAEIDAEILIWQLPARAALSVAMLSVAEQVVDHPVEKAMRHKHQA